MGFDDEEPEPTKAHKKLLQGTTGNDDASDDPASLLPPLPPAPLKRPTFLRQRSTVSADEQEATAALERDRRHLELARDSTERQKQLINEVFAVEESLEAHLLGVSTRTLELTKEILALQKEIEVLDSPRDDSLDNNTVVWVSLAFAAGGGGGGGGDDDDHDHDDGSFGASSGGGGGGGGGELSAESVHSICSLLEDAGLTVKRVGDCFEAIERARELQASKQLRCVVYGGGEKRKGCGPLCNESHEHDGPCLKCGKPWGRPYHNGHTCRRTNERGSWRVKSKKRGHGGGAGGGSSGGLSLDADAFFDLMLDPLSAFAKEHGVLVAGRVALYGGNTSTDEDVRMSLWQLGVAVRDSATDLKDWVDNIKDWENDDDEEDEDEEDDDDDGTAGSDGGKPSAVVVAGSSSAGNDDDEDELGLPPPAGSNTLDRQESSGTMRLDECRERLAELEKERTALDSGDEGQRRDLGGRAAALYEELNGLVRLRLGSINGIVQRLSAALANGLGLSLDDLQPGAAAAAAAVTAAAAATAVGASIDDNDDNEALLPPPPPEPLSSSRTSSSSSSAAKTEAEGGLSAPALSKLLALAGSSGIGGGSGGGGNFGLPGPSSGRDAALALAWVEGHEHELQAVPFGALVDIASPFSSSSSSSTALALMTTSEGNNKEDEGAAAMNALPLPLPPSLMMAALRRRTVRALRALASEQESLRQIGLAAKVMALIPSPQHKKLLNLTHDWLRTFMPHCLAKVNRVSFGLLSSKECADALKEDPMVPRSRLALAVPFIGKDVPSKSSSSRTRTSLSA